MVRYLASWMPACPALRGLTASVLHVQATVLKGLSAPRTTCWPRWSRLNRLVASTFLSNELRGESMLSWV